jgi:hypothetical protein
VGVSYSSAALSRSGHHPKTVPWGGSGCVVARRGRQARGRGVRQSGWIAHSVRGYCARASDCPSCISMTKDVPLARHSGSHHSKFVWGSICPAYSHQSSGASVNLRSSENPLLSSLRSSGLLRNTNKNPARSHGGAPHERVTVRHGTPGSQVDNFSAG